MGQEITVGNKTEKGQISFEYRASQLERLREQEEKAIEKQKEENRKSPFRKFYQVNEKNAKHLTELAEKCPKALAIFLFICEHMDGYNALMASYKVFQERFNISRTTASHCIKRLKDEGFVYVYKSGSSNVYVVNNNLVWKSYGYNVKYCKFPATIILSESEQEKECKEIIKQRFTSIENKEEPHED